MDCIVLAADQRVFLWHFLEPGQVHCFHVIWLVLIFTPPLHQVLRAMSHLWMCNIGLDIMAASLETIFDYSGHRCIGVAVADKN